MNFFSKFKKLIKSIYILISQIRLKIFKNSKKYIISKGEINKILKYGSNHPRRHDYFEKGNIFCELDKVPDFINPNKVTHNKDVLNIVIGDSHGEYTTRLYKKLLKKINDKPILSLTIHSGPITFIGSLLSKNYYNHMARNVINLNYALNKKAKKFNKINIFFSLGEIDIRTKISIECLKNKVDYKSIIDKYLNYDVNKKFFNFKLQIEKEIGPKKINLYYIIPPPPSRDSYFYPSKNTDLQKISKFIKYNPFPNLYSYNYRLKIYRYFIEKIKIIFKKSNISVIENKYYMKSLKSGLNEKNSHDLCHVSLGNWTLLNSLNILKVK